MSREAMQMALEALELLCPMQPHTQAMRDIAITALRAALAEPEQEPCAMRYDFDGYGYKYIDSGSGSNWQTRIKDAEPLFTAPPQREHITDGSPCWCNPDVIEEEGGNVIVHNYEDNWQQYAKPGETAQQCIERHRSEQDALMKLYATPRKPLTDDQIVDIWAGVSMGYDDEINIIELARAIERAHGIGEQT